MFVPRKVRKRAIDAAAAPRTRSPPPSWPSIPPVRANDNIRKDEEKLDKLTQFVFDVLSPVSLVRQQQTCAAARELVSLLAERKGEVHVARVLQLPQLRSRCKNVALLSDVLQRVALSSWWSYSAHECRVTFTPAYVSAVSQSVHALLDTSRIVYVENIPPRCKTLLDAAIHIQHAVTVLSKERQLTAVLAVYEPTRSGYPPERPQSWTAGRAFVVLNDAYAVQALSTAHPWDLSQPELFTTTHRTLRCAPLSQWLQLKEEYLALQRRPAVITAKRKAEDGGDPQQPTKSPSLTSGDDTEPWYRGTILTLPISHSSDSTHKLTQSVKATLEKVVPESVSYVHIHTSPDNGDEQQIMVRTAHPRLAHQLLQASPIAALTRMHATAEDTYWQTLPTKTRNQAHKRATTLTPITHTTPPT